MTEPTTPPSDENDPRERPGPTHTVVIPDDVQMVTLLGPRDEMLRTIERAFPRLVVHARGNEISLTGPQDDVQTVERLLDELLEIIATGQPLNRDAVERSIGMLRDRSRERPAEVLTANILSNRGRTIRPKTLGQKQYVDAIDSNTVVFGIGPAGTGKTYLAMAKAVAALQNKQVNRILLTRPAVEAGERLGFLPGTLTDKIDPYLRPLYDALHDMVDPESIPRLMAAGTIEVAPLAYMRGRAQPVDTRVLTPSGWRRFGDLEVGDMVVGSNGRPTPVIGVYPQGVRPVFRVSAQDGASTLACGEHLWTVRAEGEWVTLRTDELVGSLDRGYELPLVAPVEFVQRDLPADPYEVGLQAGLPDQVARDGGDTRTLVRATVPTEFLFAGVPERYALLQGVLATAGRRAAGYETGRWVELVTADSRLRADVVHLVRSLGGTAIASQRDSNTLEIRLPAALDDYTDEPRRHIHSIEPAGEAETMCIQVAAADSLYVTEDFLLTHNTLNDAFIILDEAQNTSPEQMKMFLTRLGFGSKMVVTGDITQVDLPGGVQSGLRVVRDILDGLDDVHFSELSAQDVVRHRLVGAIVDAYGKWDARQGHGSSRPGERRVGGRRHERRREGMDPA